VIVWVGPLVVGAIAKRVCEELVRGEQAHAVRRAAIAEARLIER
jgi:hypothetical protein